MDAQHPGLESVERSAMRKAAWHLLPILGLGYMIAYIDRVNISFAATQMNADLGFSATVYGLGAGLFFLSYALFEVPSNLLLVRFGARRWLARIMISWGALAAGMMFVRTPLHFYILRLLLGFAEAGFFPGVMYFLTHWFPASHRGRAISRFYFAGPLAAAAMGAISAWLLQLDGLVDLRGWQWLFLVQGLPAMILGLVFLAKLPETPSTAAWLNAEERAWIASALERDSARVGVPTKHGLVAALRNPMVVRLGAIGFLTLGAYYAFVLSAPTLLVERTGLDIKQVGYLVSIGGVLGALGMLVTGWHSDRIGDRFVYLVGSVLAVATTFATIGFATSPLIIISAYLFFAGASWMVTLSLWLVLTDTIHVRHLAVGAAAINCLSQLGSFVMPYGWGALKDVTQGYFVGLMLVSIIYLGAAVIVVLVASRQRRARLSPALSAV
jgi:ACS family tartrate transporter-like MFS transporter